MQQKQKKSESISKNTSNVAKMLLQRDKNRLKEQQKHAYIELLKAPRGKEYLRLLAKTTELSRQLTDIEDEIAQLEAELEQEAETLPASDALVESADEPEIPVDSERREKAEQREKSDATEEKVQDENEIKITWKSQAVQETSEIQAVKEQSTIERSAKEQPQIQVSWKNASVDTGARMKQFKEKQQRLAERKRQREAVAEEFRAAMREFEAQLPVPNKMIGLLWPGQNTELLMRYGVIACPGTAWNSPEELVEQIQPRSEQEERQWYKGGVEYERHVCDELLLVEIYMDVVCVVYKDGKTKVIE